jgi:hypothetical protein
VEHGNIYDSPTLPTPFHKYSFFLVVAWKSLCVVQWKKPDKKNNFLTQCNGSENKEDRKESNFKVKIYWVWW